jgi:hypothetical protein
MAAVAYRSRFACLWCGSAWEARGPDDLEGWAQLCPTCLGKAGTNPFLRDRLRGAIAARGGASASATGQTAVTEPRRPSARFPAPPPAFPDDWFLRRGEFERGAVHDAAWHAELDAVTRWLDGLPLRGRIAEPAAGVGFFSPLLAERGELHASDPDPAALDHARERLVAHRLLAHLHVADHWAAPGAEEPPADWVVAAFLLGRVRGAGLDAAAAALRARTGRGGRLAVVELRPDPAGGPPPGVAWTWHDPAVVDAALRRARFETVTTTATGRFFALIDAHAT